MCSLSSAAAGNRSLRSLIRCGGDAPGGNSRPARGGCSVTRRAAVRWASSCLPLLPLFRTLRDRESFLGARSLGRGRTRCDRPRRALTNPPFQPRTGRRGDLGAPMGPHPAPLPAHPVAGKTRCCGPSSRRGPLLAAQSWGASSPTFLSEHPGVRAGSSCAARRRLSRFPPDGGA